MIQLDGLSVRILASRTDVDQLTGIGLVTDVRDDPEGRVYLSESLSPVVVRSIAPAARTSEKVPVEVMPDVTDATLERHFDLRHAEGDHDIFIALMGDALLAAPAIRDTLTSVAAQREHVVIAVVASSTPDWLGQLALESTRVFLVPGAKASPPMIRAQFASKVEFVTENLRHSPRVGVGVLLIEQQGGKFFFRQRTADPEPNSLATIGGDLGKQNRVSDELERLIRQYFGPDTAAKIGPLLACTTMTNGFYHYVDLTFLALIDRPRDPSHHVTLMSSKYRRPARGYWYAASDTFEMWQPRQPAPSEKLFQPVANALQGFLRMVIASRAIHGPSEIRVPSLTNPRVTLLVPEPSVNVADTVGIDLGFTSWSPAPLPFFESGGLQ